MGLHFVDVCDVDPLSDGVDIYGVQEHYVIDYTKSAGAEWKLKAYTLDQVKYPDDPRANSEIKAGTAHGITTPAIRYLQGKKYMFTNGMYGGALRIFAFDDPPSEICRFVGQTGNGGWASWVDTKGDLWFGNDGGKISHQKFESIGSNGAPLYGPKESIDRPSPLSEVMRIIYIPEKDILYLSAYTSNNPHSGEEWGQGGREVWRYDEFSKSQFSKPTKGYPIVMIYEGMADCGQNPAHIIDCNSIAVAGNRLFVLYCIRGPETKQYSEGQARGEIGVFDCNTAQYLGCTVPGQETGGPSKCGWMDIPYCGNAFLRSNGEYLVLQEEDFFGKVLFYRIPSEDKTAPVSALRPITLDWLSAPATANQSAARYTVTGRSYTRALQNELLESRVQRTADGMVISREATGRAIKKAVIR
jgi:hypothetical protein